VNQQKRSFAVVPRSLTIKYMTRERVLLAALMLMITGLAGCASGVSQKVSIPPANAAPYVGVFTGEFVDGKPLYRFPAIEIVGSRSSIGPST
jgi:hypothetical protein